MLMRLILLAILIFIVVRIFRSWSLPGSRDSRRARPSRSGNQVSDMIQDPCCGVYVARKDAFPARTSSGMLFFCSEECCRKYLQTK